MDELSSELGALSLPRPSTPLHGGSVPACQGCQPHEPTRLHGQRATEAVARDPLHVSPLGLPLGTGARALIHLAPTILPTRAQCPWAATPGGGRQAWLCEHVAGFSVRGQL